MLWTELPKTEKVNLVKKAWKPNLSAAKIAMAVTKLLNDANQGAKQKMTRQQIIGLYTRHPDLKSTHPLDGGRGGRFQKTPKPKSDRLNPIGEDVKPPREPFVVRRALESILYDEASYQVPMKELDTGLCHWPVNNPDKCEEHLFCGLDTPEGEKYCTHHQGRAGYRARFSTKD